MSTTAAELASLPFYQLPVDPDQGLPQAFSCTIGTSDYDIGLYASISPAASDPLQAVYDLAGPRGLAVAADPPGYLVLRIVRQDPDRPHVIFLRKVIPDPALIHAAAELAVKVVTAVVARGNLNGSGSYGSQIVIGVAQRWA